MNSYRPPQAGQPQPIRCCPVMPVFLVWVHEDRTKSEKQAQSQCTSRHEEKKSSSTLKLGTWNVRTLQTGLNEKLPDIEDVRKSAIINDKLSRLKVDIAALQETRLPDSGSIKEKDYSFFWQGKAESEIREHGVGFAVKNTLLNTVELKCNGSERLLSLRLNTSIGHVTLICAYAPTLSSTPEAKDMFYDNLSSALSEIPTTEQVIILGDLNARVGSDNSA
uniref:Endonuclease/exonuclease/phosphatase domain-containing protein n=1 Tax=Biomphalaria glabrata TaxID=6526 RepID=A0A2C9KIE6_BIOGL